MEAESDGEEEVRVERSGMIRPSLVTELRRILSEYPDGEQIIRELLQNAEDAGASVVKILHDQRGINREPERNKGYSKYTKHFQAPALCVYNDAVFSDNDWGEIKKLSGSIKENDRLKVGRFGLGFKSVFHITDCPCILSGDRLLMIDPLQDNPDHVTSTIKLANLDSNPKFVATILNAFKNTFGVTSKTIEDGYYPGTIIWLPLRHKASELSDTLYNEDKVNRLFKEFNTDAPSVLIFLKNVSCASLHKRNDEQSCEEVSRAEIIDISGDAPLTRKEFKETVEGLSRDYNGEAIHCAFIMTIRTSDSLTRDSQDIQWVVVNYFMGGNATEEFRALIVDESIDYSPYVGVAAPVGQIGDNFKGDIFCFLPLPKDDSRQTGLPVHVNGMFALSENRHIVKWAPEENMKTDKLVAWNERLISEALPAAYEILLVKAIQQSELNGNTTESITTVYQAIPDQANVRDKWKKTSMNLFDRMKSKPMLYRHKTEFLSGKWLPLDDATFATLEQWHDDVQELEVKDCIIQLLKLIQENVVEAPKGVFDKLNLMFTDTLEDMTPSVLSKLLKREQNSKYKTIPDKDKYLILKYLLSENCYDNVQDLELLPLASGNWISFSEAADDAYVCTEETLELFQGQESRIIKMQPEFPELLTQHFHEMADKGVYQLRKLAADSAKRLLRDAIRSVHKHFMESGHVSVVWLQKVWRFLIEHRAVSDFQDTPIVPIRKHGHWPTPENVELVRLSDALIVQKSDGRELPETVSQALKALSVKIIPDLPSWISDEDYVKHYFNMPNSSSVLKVITQVAARSKPGILLDFNQSSGDCREELVKYLSKLTDASEEEKNALRRLKIFKQRKSPCSSPAFVSLSENNSFCVARDFPVDFPKPLLDIDEESISFVKLIGAHEIRFYDVILQTLTLVKDPVYNHAERTKFMKYFMKNFQRVESQRAIVESAKKVQFLKTSSEFKCPSALYNPKDSVLGDLLHGEDLLPSDIDSLDETDMHVLKVLGLKEVNDLTVDVLFHTAEILDGWSKNENNKSSISRKAAAFLQILQNNKAKLDLKHLARRVANLHCIKYADERLDSFPEYLPWYSSDIALAKPSTVRNIVKCNLGGSIIPLVSVSDPVSVAFEWNTDPPIVSVLKQLQIVKEHYKVTRKPELLPIIRDIYKMLNVHLNDECVEEASELVWTGEDFHTSAIAVIQSSSLNLAPYMYYIPEEFRCFHKLFSRLGCSESISADILLRVLSKISQKHLEVQNADVVCHDLELVRNILQQLLTSPTELMHCGDSLLLPVKTNDKMRLTMKPVSQCTLHDENDDEDPVHEAIMDIAKILLQKSKCSQVQAATINYLTN